MTAWNSFSHRDLVVWATESEENDFGRENGFETEIGVASTGGEGFNHLPKVTKMPISTAEIFSGKSSLRYI